MKSLFVSLGVAFAMLSLPTTVMAYEKCSCAVPMSRAFGKISQVTGDVQASGKSGFEQAVNGMTIGLGSRILVGANSSASLDLGEPCRLQISAGADVTVSPAVKGSNLACVKVTQSFETGPIVREAGFPDESNRESRFGMSNGQGFFGDHPGPFMVFLGAGGFIGLGAFAFSN